MDEHKRHEMDKMNDMFGMQYSISVENQPYPVLCTLSPDGCTAHSHRVGAVPSQPNTAPKSLLSGDFLFYHKGFYLDWISLYR